MPGLVAIDPPSASSRGALAPWRSRNARPNRATWSGDARAELIPPLSPRRPNQSLRRRQPARLPSFLQDLVPGPIYKSRRSAGPGPQRRSARLLLSLRRPHTCRKLRRQHAAQRLQHRHRLGRPLQHLRHAGLGQQRRQLTAERRRLLRHPHAPGIPSRHQADPPRRARPCLPLPLLGRKGMGGSHFDHSRPRRPGPGRKPSHQPAEPLQPPLDAAMDRDQHRPGGRPCRPQPCQCAHRGSRDAG